MNKIYSILTNSSGIHRQTEPVKLPSIVKHKLNLLIPNTNLEYISYQAEQLIQLLMTISPNRVKELDPGNLYTSNISFPINTEATVTGDLSNKITVLLTNSKQLSGNYNVLVTSNTVTIKGNEITYNTSDGLSEPILIAPGVSIVIRDSSSITGTHNICVTYQLPFKNNLLDTYNKVKPLITTSNSGSIPEQLTNLILEIVSEVV